MRSALALVALAACAAPTGQTVAPPPLAAVDPLLGWWDGDGDFGPAQAGTLVVHDAATGWTAALGDAAADLRPDGDGWRGAVGDGEVRLRRDGEGRLRGFWIQPGGLTLGQRYATPVVLVRGGDGAHRGAVAPVRDAIHVGMAVAWRDGRRVAWLREREKNLGSFLGDLAVEVAPDGTVTWRAADGTAVMTAPPPVGDRLTVAFDGAPAPVVLVRRRPAGARPAYRYAPPPVTDDGWPVADAAAVGVDPARLAAVVERIRATTPTSVHAPAVHALVVARHGQLVLDEYFAGADRDALHDLRSAGKTWSTTLLGIAIDRGLVALGDRAFDRLGVATADPGHRAITLAHLASMSSGLDCDDHDRASPGNEDRMQAQRDQPDWYAYAAALPLVRAPGSRGVYCTGALNLLGAVLGRATGQWLPDLFAAWLAEPLGITRYHLNLMPTGDGYLGGGLRLRARDFAKLPQLVLTGGVWAGRRVVSAAWLVAATAAHASLSAPDDYGYGWWRRTLRVGGREVPVVFASGNGGQLAIAAPTLDAVVVIQAGNYGDFAVWQGFFDDVVVPVLAAIDATPPRSATP